MNFHGANSCGQSITSMGSKKNACIRGSPLPPPPPGAAVHWMQETSYVPDCPPGLEYLAQIDRILIQKKFHTIDGDDNRKQYEIFNQIGQPVFFASVNESGCCASCMGGKRFNIDILDNYFKEVMQVKSKFNCFANLCQRNEASIEAPAGNVIGVMKQKLAFFSKTFEITRSDGGVNLQIKSAKKTAGDDVYKIKASKIPIGEIRGDAKRFSLNVPMTMHVKGKAALLGAALMINHLCCDQEEAGTDDSTQMQ